MHVQAGEPRPETSSTSFAGGDPEQLVHALAQLPDEVTGHVWCSRERAARLRLLAEAYALADRFRTWDTPGKERCTVEGAGEGSAGPAAAQMIEALWPEGAGRSRLVRPDGAMAGHRICLITNLPAHYRMPLFTGMSRRAAAAGANLRILFLGGGARTRPWLSRPQTVEFDHGFVHSLPVPVRRRPPLVPLDLERHLHAFQPTILISGGFSPLVSSRAARYAASTGASFGIWTGEIARMPTARNRLRRAQRRRLLHRADFAIAYGSESAEYVSTLAPDLPTVLGRNTSPGARRGIPRSESDPVELVCVGDLSTSRKAVDVLIAALARLPALGCRLTVIGEGRQRPLLERQAATDSRIRFLGALDADSVRQAYSRSDVCLFPTRADIFGLVIPEAMSAGLATVVSSAAGAASDLAIPGVNCLMADPEDDLGWAAAIDELVSNPRMRARMGEAAMTTISRRWTLDHAVEAMMAGIRLGALQARGKDLDRRR